MYAFEVVIRSASGAIEQKFFKQYKQNPKDTAQRGAHTWYSLRDAVAARFATKSNQIDYFLIQEEEAKTVKAYGVDVDDRGNTTWKGKLRVRD